VCVCVCVLGLNECYKLLLGVILEKRILKY